MGANTKIANNILGNKVVLLNNFLNNKVALLNNFLNNKNTTILSKLFKKKFSAYFEKQLFEKYIVKFSTYKSDVKNFNNYVNKIAKKQNDAAFDDLYNILVKNKKLYLFRKPFNYY